MKIWELDDQNLENIILVNRVKGLLGHLVNQFQGKSIQNWEPLSVKSVKGHKSDAVSFLTGIPIFSQEAINIVDKFLKSTVEILPLAHEGYNLFALNVINVVDCIDYEKAIVDEIIPGFFTGFKKYAFKAGVLRGQHIFKIPEQLKNKVFVSDEFRNQVLQSKLKGFKFIEVWDSEEDLQAQEAAHQNYIRILEKIEREKGPEFSFSEAISKLEAGMAVASGKEKMQHNDKNELFIGNLQEDGNYAWLKTIYYPPNFLQLKWHVVAKSDI
jgi:hypothetical protein